MTRRSFQGWLLLACWWWWPASAYASEATLRAAFIYNFIKFIEWPSLSADGNIRLCALDDESEMHRAVSALNGRPAGNHTIQVSHISPLRLTKAVIQHCQMLYINNSVHLLPDGMPEGVMVVANEVPTTNPAVSIALHLNRSGRIEFSINTEAMLRTNATVSSQLLKLATNQQGGG